jgi:hypothetical protein
MGKRRRLRRQIKSTYIYIISKESINLKAKHMKKTTVNLILLTVTISVVATAAVATAEHFFGPVAVFLFAVAVTATAGLWVLAKGH